MLIYKKTHYLQISIIWKSPRSSISWDYYCFVRQDLFQADLELMILLPLPAKCWDYRHVPPCPTPTSWNVQKSLYLSNETNPILTIASKSLHLVNYLSSSLPLLQPPGILVALEHPSPQGVCVWWLIPELSFLKWLNDSLPFGLLSDVISYLKLQPFLPLFYLSIFFYNTIDTQCFVYFTFYHI
jgi:hypothetical protein